MERRDGRGRGDENIPESEHFGGLDDTGGLGAVPGVGAPRISGADEAGGVSRGAKRDRNEDDAGRYEDPDLTGDDIAGSVPGRTEDAKGDAPSDDESSEQRRPGPIAESGFDEGDLEGGST